MSSARERLRRIVELEQAVTVKAKAAERVGVVEALMAEGRVTCDDPLMILVRDEREAKELEAQLGEDAVLVACSREWKRRGLPD